ncbi:MAG: D-arabinono-1,4-lactone oxidase [Myxococcota bacterium]
MGEGRRHGLSRRGFVGGTLAGLAALAGFRRRAAAAVQWSNWSGSVRASPHELARPASVDDVVAALRSARAQGRTVRAVGSGHSFVPLCATDGVAMTLAPMRGVASIDRERREATVLAGSKLYELGQPLRQAGLAMETLPDIDRQEIAGAIATGTHGTGREIGNLSTQVVGLSLVTGSGDVVRCSARERPDILRAAQVSLGALGIITHVRLRLLPAYRLHEKTRIASYDETAAQLAARIESNRHFEFFWVSDRDACLLKTLNPTEVQEDSEHYVDEERLVGERVGWSDRILPSVRATAFNEIEYAVPAEQGSECLAELRELMLGKYKDVAWPLEYRTVAADDIFLSPAHGRPTVTISAHQSAELPYTPFFADVEAVFRNHNGRPHWGKIHTLQAADLAALYPKWTEFQKVRQELDPEGLFLSPYVRNLLL